MKNVMEKNKGFRVEVAYKLKLMCETQSVFYVELNIVEATNKTVEYRA